MIIAGQAQPRCSRPCLTRLTILSWAGVFSVASTARIAHTTPPWQFC